MKSTGYNLMLSAIYNGRKGDRPPGGSPTSVVCKGLMDACGVSFPQAHVDAQAMAELALAGHEILGFDNVMPEYRVHQESAAIGCQVDWGDRDTMPDAKTFPYSDFSDVQIPDNILEKPSMRVVLDARGVVKRVGHKMSLVGCINNAQTLYQGTPEDVYSQARYAIEAGVNVIGPECAIPLATPLENLKAITSAVCEGY